MDHLRIIWQTGETLLESVPFDGDPECSRYNILLAVQEKVTNVLRYGYHGDPGQPVEVGFIVSDQSVEVTIRDMGPEFNPLEHQTASLDARDGLLEESGYGIQITKAIMDHLEYSREEGCNVVRMTKLVGARVGAGQGSGLGPA